MWPAPCYISAARVPAWTLASGSTTSCAHSPCRCPSQIFSAPSLSQTDYSASASARAPAPTTPTPRSRRTLSRVVFSSNVRPSSCGWTCRSAPYWASAWPPPCARGTTSCGHLSPPSRPRSTPPPARTRERASAPE
eukprot:1177694-Prorocentrum_minimum.AAC.1